MNYGGVQTFEGELTFIGVVLCSCVLMMQTMQVGWDESTAGERQRRVSLWEIEPLTTPFLLCPPPLTFRAKRPWGGRGNAFCCIH